MRNFKSILPRKFFGLRGDKPADLERVITEIATEVVVNSVPSAPYLVYTALLTQTEDTAPVPIVLQDTIGDITWVYDTDGIYMAQNPNGVFDIEKTVVFIGDTATAVSSNLSLAHVKVLNDNEIQVSTIFGANDTFVNEELLATPFEIRIYP